MKKLFKSPLTFICLFTWSAIAVSCDNGSDHSTGKVEHQTEQPTAETPEHKEEKTPSANPDMTRFVKEVDTNGDGQMSREEWEGKGLPPSSFNMFEKGRGYVTLEDYQKNPAPDGIDINGDGTLTVAEFVEFDKVMSEKMKDGDAPQPEAEQH